MRENVLMASGALASPASQKVVVTMSANVDEFGRTIKSDPIVREGGLHGEERIHRARHHQERPPFRNPSPRRSERPTHPSSAYVKGPLLCEVVWKDKHPNDQGPEGDADGAAYSNYRKKYCLDYVRSFFNQRIDDSWFRTRYSPAVKEEACVQECNRAGAESRAFLTQLQADAAAFIEKAKLSGSSGPPSSHFFTSEKEQKQVLTMRDVPPTVTDYQLRSALLDLCDGKVNAEDIMIYGCTQVPLHGQRALCRNVLVVANPDALKQICKGESDDVRVDCTDPYGRTEYDGDDHGNAPSHGRAIPQREVTLPVKWLRQPAPSTVRLSAALSVRQQDDAFSASNIALHWDMERQIPPECNWSSIRKAVQEHTSDALEEMDVCIAYLRRVHLVSFYNGADQPASCIADVLLGHHPASKIHVRLPDAQSVLDSHNDEVKHEQSDNTEMTPKDEESVKMEEAAEATAKEEVDENRNNAKTNIVKDMLVQRLEDSLEKALTVKGLSDEIKQKAASIRREESKMQDIWLKNHTLAEGESRRARCSFHFCQKLFKDNSFLHKHLLKKHSEYLRASQAKCHDDEMMKAWDEETARPVPEIQVDCGQLFGLVPSRVSGKVPDCVDPEPALWKREEQMRRDKEQRNREMQARREQARRSFEHDSGQHVKYEDIDDLKEEKIEVSFENIDIPIKKKKKKKKRKLL